jgi:riboflavin kinase/FMN adenylyltransferase
MKVYHSLDEIKRVRGGSIVAVGIFDGVHKGHVRVIRSLVKRARMTGAKSLVLTFYPHPRSVLHPEKAVPLVISVKHRVMLLESLGVDIVIPIRFTRRFSRIKAEEFAGRILHKRFGAREVYLGGNFQFGAGGRGDVNLIKKLGRTQGFKVRNVRLLKKDKRVISSTYIRRLITSGRLKEASGLLGRPVSILGTVKRGTRRGRILGFRTANIDPHHEAIPPSGVYAVFVLLQHAIYKGVTNIGFRPTFHRKGPLPDPTVEVHLFDFKGNLYGRDIEVIFVKKLRAERHFQDRENLKKRIALDAAKAKRLLSASQSCI